MKNKIIKKSWSKMQGFSIATMLVITILAAVPVVVESKELDGIDPTSPGFRYNPNENISVSGKIYHESDGGWSGDGPTLPTYDEAFFNTTYPLQMYGSNVNSASRFVRTINGGSHYHPSWGYSCWSSTGWLGSGYTTSANIRVISFSSGSSGYSRASVTSSIPFWDPWAKASGGHDPSSLHVSFPFSVSDNGTLFVQEASMDLLVGCGGNGFWGYECSVDATWTITKEGFGTIAGDVLHLSKNGQSNPYGGAFSDDYTGEREISLAAGDYNFDVSYRSFNSAWAGGIEADGYVSPTDIFTLTLKYL